MPSLPRRGPGSGNRNGADLSAPALDELVARLGEPDSASRSEAAFLLGELGDRRATLALAAALERAKLLFEVIAIARALGKLGDPRAVPALVAKSADSASQFWVLEALLPLACNEALPAFRRALASRTAKAMGVIGLARLGDPDLASGTIDRFLPERGFGFLRAARERRGSIFFHVRDWDDDGDPIEGQFVTFHHVRSGPKPFAVRVRPLDRKAAPVLADEPGEQHTGVVRWFDEKRGYGFVRIDGSGDDAFAHHREIRSRGFRTLAPGDRVAFVAHRSERGVRACAIERR